MTVLSLEKRKFDCHSEPALRQRLESQGYSVFAWQDRPGAYYSPHSHDHDEFIVVHQGTIRFLIDGKPYDLEPGDLLNLPAHTVHEAINEGTQTVRYYICSRS